MKRFLCIFVWISFLVFSITAGANATQLIVNGTFDDGFNNWVVNPTTNASIANWGPSHHGMNGNAALLGSGQSGAVTLSQQFNIAGSYDSLLVEFDWFVFSKAPATTLVGATWGIGVGEYFSEVIVNEVYADPAGNFNFAKGHASVNIDLSLLGNLDGNILIGYYQDISGGSYYGAAAIDNVSAIASPVPEPATLFLFGLGILGIAGVSRKKYQG